MDLGLRMISYNIKNMDKNIDKNMDKKRRNQHNKTKKRGGDNVPTVLIYSKTNISTEPNTDPAYTQKGLIHYSSSSSVNFLRQTVTGIGSIFGAKTLDVGPLNALRNTMLYAIDSSIAKNQKVNNLRINVENDGQSLIFCHMYGTLYENPTIPAI